MVFKVIRRCLRRAHRLTRSQEISARRAKVTARYGPPGRHDQAEHGLWSINRRLRWPVGERHEPRSRGVGQPEMTIAGMQPQAGNRLAGKVMDVYADGRPLIYSPAGRSPSAGSASHAIRAARSCPLALRLPRVRPARRYMNQSHLLCVLVVCKTSNAVNESSRLTADPDASQAGECWRQSYSASWY